MLQQRKVAVITYTVLYRVYAVEGMFDKAYDKCFCEECASERCDVKVHEMGNPKQKFAVPWGYAKFGVK